VTLGSIKTCVGDFGTASCSLDMANLDCRRPMEDLVPFDDE